MRLDSCFGNGLLCALYASVVGLRSMSISHAAMRMLMGRDHGPTSPFRDAHRAK